MARSNGFSSANIFAAILSLGALANAAPLIARGPTYNYTNTSGIVPSASAPAAPAATTYSSPPVVPYAQPIATVFPDFTSQYNSKTGAVDFHTASGLVSRSTNNGGADITTLVTFTLGEQYKSNTCQLVFDLVSPSSSVSGSAKAQLFTSLAPATADSSSWPSGNLRNQNLGAIDVVAHGRATWQAGSGPGATADGVFPCSAITGQIYGGEIVPQGDNVQIQWPAGHDGVKIIVW
ncbi:uncharacterized protein A1O9_03527 [Exophiala aquamarina CBS 119918]|uniref:Ubiquitin 3 binding protein But2 C-terminal domain-containing protein n=1 Tax=Exophiala aquamarina CBS 119918 TaxID=1182545 RepID=A0A072Q239_9EURO|nr:uncharacterized protein A1O9_03527 [Exophiala aquamarina CBS 119918]KEF61955.1 hypothetical protein A1O9_03527 [Exophiala aquamarina CBS 119918]